MVTLFLWITAYKNIIKVPSSGGGRDWVNTANNINTGIGVGTGVLGGNYGLTANQTFKYGIRQGNKIISASQRTAMHFSHSMKVAGVLGRINIVTGTIGTIYSGSQVYSQYQDGGWQSVNLWDAGDTLMGGIGVGAGIATFLISNPVGWGVAAGIGIGVGVYFGGRLVYDLSINK